MGELYLFGSLGITGDQNGSLVLIGAHWILKRLTEAHFSKCSKSSMFKILVSLGLSGVHQFSLGLTGLTGGSKGFTGVTLKK